MRMERKGVHVIGETALKMNRPTTQHFFSSLMSRSNAALCGHLFGREVSGVRPTSSAAAMSSPASSIFMRHD